MSMLTGRCVSAVDDRANARDRKSEAFEVCTAKSAVSSIFTAHCEGNIQYKNRKGGEILERLFNLDPQLLHDAVLLAIAVFVMFLLLSYLLFNPARDFLKKREERVKNNIDSANKAKEDAQALRAEYEEKLRCINKEADEVMSAARKKALENEARIIEDAKAEAARIIERANHQTELAVKKAEDDIKKEIIAVSSLIAEKVIRENIDLSIQDSLVDDTLKEIGEKTWQS